MGRLKVQFYKNGTCKAYARLKRLKGTRKQTFPSWLLPEHMPEELLMAAQSVTHFLGKHEDLSPDPNVQGKSVKAGHVCEHSTGVRG